MTNESIEKLLLLPAIDRLELFSDLSASQLQYVCLMLSMLCERQRQALQEKPAEQPVKQPESRLASLIKRIIKFATGGIPFYKR